MAKQVKRFVEYFSGVKYRVPHYEDGSVGRPEILGRFTSLQNEEETSAYKEEEQEEQQEDEQTVLETTEGDTQFI